jgi:transposase InsO family protein
LALTKAGIKPIRIYPGSPWENGYNKRFNGTLRREVLNAEWFTSIRQAQIVIETWLKQYNHIRPHQALNMKIVSLKPTHETKNNPSSSIFWMGYFFQGNENSEHGRNNSHLNCRFFHC